MFSDTNDPPDSCPFTFRLTQSAMGKNEFSLVKQFGIFGQIEDSSGPHLVRKNPSYKPCKSESCGNVDATMCWQN